VAMKDGSLQYSVIKLKISSRCLLLILAAAADITAGLITINFLALKI